MFRPPSDFSVHVSHDSPLHRVLIYVNFFLNNLDLLLIASNSWFMGVSLGEESQFLPWREVVQAPLGSSENEGWNELNEHFSYIKNCTSSCPSKLDYDESSFVRAIPDHFDRYGARCLDRKASDSFILNVVASTCAPLLLLILATLLYKLKLARLHVHSYGSWGHVNAVVAVNNAAPVRILLACICVSTFSIIFFAFLFTDEASSSWDSPNFNLSFFTSFLNIALGFNTQRAHCYVNLSYPTGDAGKIKLGYFRWYRRCEKILNLVEDAALDYLTTGSSAILVDRVKIRQEDCATLKESIMESVEMQTHSVMTFLETRGRSSSKVAFDDDGDDKGDNKGNDSSRPENLDGGSEGSAPRTGRALTLLAKALSFLFVVVPFFVAIMNAFEVIFTIVTERRSVLTALSFKSPLSYSVNFPSTEEGDLGERPIEPFTIADCRLNDLAIPYLLGRDYGDLNNVSFRWWWPTCEEGNKVICMVLCLLFCLPLVFPFVFLSHSSPPFLFSAPLFQ